eukprot:TRINITY_DN20883_c0_g1_i2.p1 TRINITY_DN20883_c0_g1~~TRINITY_DN20883_c0_g1_i2.p1  ORF type:complete len:385 (+),score=51.60 TRINITY_DN20883_c0_g1_i2:94-1155(+)
MAVNARSIACGLHGFSVLHRKPFRLGRRGAQPVLPTARWCSASTMSSVKESWLDFRQQGGLRHRILEHGSTSDRLVLFFHANSIGPGPWLPVVRRLSGLCTVAVEIRGHGETDAPEGDDHYHWKYFADDFHRIVDAIAERYGRAPDAIVTHSFSGDCALLAIADKPSTVKDVKRVVLLDPVIVDAQGADSGATRLHGATRRLGEREAGGWPSVLELCTAFERTLLRTLERDGLDPEALQAFGTYSASPDADGRWRLKNKREVEAAIYLNRVSLSSSLAEKSVDADVQLVFTKKRRAKPEMQADAFTRDWKEAEMVVEHCRSGSSVHLVNGVGHFLVIEAPDVVADCLRDLLPE